MGDINLTSPLSMSNPAVTVNNYSWVITPDQIIVNLNYKDSGGSIVKQEVFYIQGLDYDTLKNSVISSGEVGQKYIDVIEKAIRNKVLSLKGWVGTVS